MSDDDGIWRPTFVDNEDFDEKFDRKFGLGEDWPDRIDFDALAQTEPEPTQWVMENWVPEGYCTMFGGHGGMGKSTIALVFMVCVALGRDFFGVPVTQKRVMYLSCEDRENELHIRLDRVCRYLDVSIEELKDNLVAYDLVGNNTTLWQSNLGTKEQTVGQRWLRREISVFEPQLLVIDGVSDVFMGNENDRGEVKSFVNLTLSLAHTVILLAHVNKMTAKSATTSEGYSGSTAWHNAVRARWYLYREGQEDDDEEALDIIQWQSSDLILELQKSNMGRWGERFRLSWSDADMMFVGSHIEPPTELDKKAMVRRERNDVLAAIQEHIANGDALPDAKRGPNTTFNVLYETSAFPDSLRGESKAKAKRARFAGHIRALIEMGEIESVEAYDTQRNKRRNLELRD